ncbi:hypothetical protein K1719_014993 [Acacia pycnantha]|nr:hypothetical protein K1719_014993 [Acacia pycnantha]
MTREVHLYKDKISKLKLNDCPEKKPFSTKHQFLNGAPMFNGISSVSIISLVLNQCSASNDCCTWPGVACDNITGLGTRVLKMSNDYFSGNIPESLGNCSPLQHLSINGNSLSGRLPKSIFQLQNLKELYMQYNKLSGPLNSEVGNLSNLVKLDIPKNEFSGILPDIFHSLTRLDDFSAGWNKFTGQLPATLVNSPSLQMLRLTKNSSSCSIIH